MSEATGESVGPLLVTSSSLGLSSLEEHCDGEGCRFQGLLYWCAQTVDGSLIAGCCWFLPSAPLVFLFLHKFNKFVLLPVKQF